jgi:SulP family sulfate permease
MAGVLFVKRMGELLTVSKVLPDASTRNGKVVPYMVREGHDCPQISIFTVEGPLFFGAAALFQQSIMKTIHCRPNIMILRMGRVPLLDTTGEATLAGVVKNFRKGGGIVLISGIQPQPMDMLRKSGLAEEIGSAHFFARTGEAITYALRNLDVQRCAGCRHNAFRECAALCRQPAAAPAMPAADSLPEPRRPHPPLATP